MDVFDNNLAKSVLLALRAGAGGGTTGLLQTQGLLFVCSSVASDNFWRRRAYRYGVEWSLFLAAGSACVIGRLFGRGGHMGHVSVVPVFWPRPGYCVSTGTLAGAV